MNTAGLEDAHYKRMVYKRMVTVDCHYIGLQCQMNDNSRLYLRVNACFAVPTVVPKFCRPQSA